MKARRPRDAGEHGARRDFLKVGALVGAASVLGSCAGIADPGSQRVPTPVPPPLGAARKEPPTSVPPAPPLPSAATPLGGPPSNAPIRIAHISDMHIEPTGPGVQGFTRALRHLHALEPRVDLVLNTGDCVMDSLEADEGRARLQWDAFNAVLRAECSLPVYHAIGNHDVLGWGARGPSADAESDKALAIEQLGIPARYYSFGAGAWRFLVLDSTHVAEVAGDIPYTGRLDEEQYRWLELQLETTPASTPICIVSHIPVLAACEFLDGDNETSGNWIVPGAWVHIDARRLWKLFWDHPNVRLCLSGHTHQVEDLRYHGVKYLTNGAICANWWNGSYFDFPPGYVALSLNPDGSSESEFIAY